MWELILFQGILKHFTAPLCGGGNAFQECQACLKHVLLVMEDTVEKIPLIWQQRFWPKATFCLAHTYTHGHTCNLPADGLWVLALFFSVMFFSVAADWQTEAEVSPGPPSPARIVILFSPLCLCWYIRVTSGAFVSETSHNDSKVNSCCGLRVKEGSAVKETGCEKTLKSN